LWTIGWKGGDTRDISWGRDDISWAVVVADELTRGAAAG
jgi:hypothetical protein